MCAAWRRFGCHHVADCDDNGRLLASFRNVLLSKSARTSCASPLDDLCQFTAAMHWLSPTIESVAQCLIVKALNLSVVIVASCARPELSLASPCRCHLSSRL